MFKEKSVITVYLLVAGLVAGCVSPIGGGGETNPLVESPTSLPPFECNDALSCVDIGPGEPIHIAWMQATSGPFRLLGVSSVRGAELALNEIGFELLGHPIKWDGVDSLCTLEGGQAAAEQLATDSTVVAVIGPTCAPEALGLATLSSTGLVIISPSITHPDLTDPASPLSQPGIFRTAHNDALQGKIAAEFTFQQLGLKTAATITDETLYSQSLQQAFADTFSALGGTITGEEEVYSTDTDLAETFARLTNDSPQAIYLPVFEPLGAHIASQKCSVLGLEGAQMIGADALLTDLFASHAGECSIGMVLSGPYIDPAFTAPFINSYVDQYGEGPASPFAPHAYDAMKLILAAIEGVAVLELDGSLHIPRQALRDQLAGISEFIGLTGTLSCNSTGDCGSTQTLAIFKVTRENVEAVSNLQTNLPVWLPNR
jgi:branched-chain amino acid transport system substrate-binding protein